LADEAPGGVAGASGSGSAATVPPPLGAPAPSQGLVVPLFAEAGPVRADSPQLFPAAPEALIRPSPDDRRAVPDGLPIAQAALGTTVGDELDVVRELILPDERAAHQFQARPGVG